MMPKLDGFEVAQRLRKNPADRPRQHHHADREGALVRQGPRAAVGRRRLHHQAVRSGGAARPRQGNAPPGQGDAHLSPLTGLPGNIRIQEEIQRQVRGGSGRSRCCTATSTTSRRTTTARVRARRPGHPGPGTRSSETVARARRVRRVRRTCRRRRLHRVVKPEAAEDAAQADLPAVRRGLVPSHCTTPRISSAASVRSRTGRGPAGPSRCSRSRSASPRRRGGAFATTARPSPWRPR